MKIPVTTLSAFTTAVMPMCFFVISRTASKTLISSLTQGTASPVRMTSRTCVRSLLPKAPPGWLRAKSSLVKPLACMQATARASPMASVAVVEDVGAKLRGQASAVTCTFKFTSAFLASELLGFPVIVMRAVPSRFNTGMTVKSSPVSPE